MRQISLLDGRSTSVYFVRPRGEGFCQFPNNPPTIDPSTSSQPGIYCSLYSCTAPGYDRARGTHYLHTAP